MKKNIRFILPFFVTVACIVFLASCKNPDDGDDNETTTTTSAISTTTTAGGGAEALIDIHGHSATSAADASYLVEQLENWKVQVQVLMHPPTALLETFDTESLVQFFSLYPRQFLFMYGGYELQPILHGLGRPTAFTIENVYPNGGEPPDAEESLSELEQIAKNKTEWEDTFKSLARSAAESGLYAGFGEIAPLHFSLHEGQPSIEYPADHDMLLWLSDLAAEHGLPLDVHCEATDETVAELANLLDHNTDTAIIWDHAGWSNTGMATAELLSQMMTDHENLYLSLKLRTAKTDERKAAYPLNTSGQIKEAWRSLLEAQADRIMLGMDLKYFIDSESTISKTLDSTNSLLDQLPAETAEKIAYDTAAELFGL